MANILIIEYKKEFKDCKIEVVRSLVSGDYLIMAVYNGQIEELISGQKSLEAIKENDFGNKDLTEQNIKEIFEAFKKMRLEGKDKYTHSLS